MNKSMISQKSAQGGKKGVKEFDPEAFVRPGITVDDVREVKEVGTRHSGIRFL